MNDFLVLQKEYFVDYVNNLLVLLMVYLMILEKDYFVQILHILQQNLVVYFVTYLVVYEKDYFLDYLDFLQMISMYLLLYLVRQQHTINIVLILFR